MFEWIIVYTHIYIYFTFEKYIYIKKILNSFQFLLVINHLVSPYMDHQVQMDCSKQLMG